MSFKKNFIKLMENVDINYQPEVKPNNGSGLTKFAPTPANKVLRNYNVNSDFLRKAIGYGGVNNQAVDQIMGAIDTQTEPTLDGGVFDNVIGSFSVDTVNDEPVNVVSNADVAASSVDAGLSTPEDFQEPISTEPIDAPVESPIEPQGSELSGQPVTPTEPIENEPVATEPEIDHGKEDKEDEQDIPGTLAEGITQPKGNMVWEPSWIALWNALKAKHPELIKDNRSKLFTIPNDPTLLSAFEQTSPRLVYLGNCDRNEVLALANYLGVNQPSFDMFVSKDKLQKTNTENHAKKPVDVYSDNHSKTITESLDEQQVTDFVYNVLGDQDKIQIINSTIEKSLEDVDTQQLDVDDFKSEKFEVYKGTVTAKVTLPKSEVSFSAEQIPQILKTYIEDDEAIQTIAEKIPELKGIFNNLKGDSDISYQVKDNGETIDIIITLDIDLQSNKPYDSFVAPDDQ